MKKPILRGLDFQRVVHLGEEMWLLGDPLRLGEGQLIMPAFLAPLVNFCDGNHTIPQIHQAFQEYMNTTVPLGVMEDAINALDEAYLLKNQRSEQAKLRVLAAYRHQPHRPPALADRSYPADPRELAQYFAEFAPDDSQPNRAWRGRGIVSPHIDYQRGGDVYAKVWRRAAEAVQEADLILVFGTDHKGGGLLTLTQQAYATPFGVLPTDVGLIAKLANAIGETTAYADELNHRDEHSIELSAVWLHHALEGKTPPPVIPILCGSFRRFWQHGLHPDGDEGLAMFHEVLRRENAGKKVIAIASVDFAHVGPAFDDDYVMDQQRRADLVVSDKSLISAVGQGDVGRFYDEIVHVKDKNKICGFTPIYHMLTFLGNTTGVEVAYQHCSADDRNESLVSIAGILLE
ncbi:MAG: AmmeMemoRadiSam system protein B [Methylococcales bacterium]|nr:AmmeMemoRadiSam system protein B [Methylococcales bacterium]